MYNKTINVYNIYLSIAKLVDIFVLLFNERFIGDFFVVFHHYVASKIHYSDHFDTYH